MKSFPINTSPASLFAKRLASISFCLLSLAVLSSVAVAQNDKRTQVTGVILGVGIGANLDDVRHQLDRLGTPANRSEDEDKDESGSKEMWTLKGTDYSYLVLKTDDKERVVWVSAFLRPGKEIPFSRLGDLSLAKAVTDSQAVWIVATPSGGHRLVAKGQNGKARVVYLISLTGSPTAQKN